jgi:hypothetical protein
VGAASGLEVCDGCRFYGGRCDLEVMKGKSIFISCLTVRNLRDVLPIDYVVVHQRPSYIEARLTQQLNSLASRPYGWKRERTLFEKGLIVVDDLCSNGIMRRLTRSMKVPKLEKLYTEEDPVESMVHIIGGFGDSSSLLCILSRLRDRR